MSPLDRKLLRDLRRMKGQAVAIALVIAAGVMLQVMMSGLVVSLEETRRAYYERERLADIFAPLVRAPVSVTRRIGQIPGVARVEGRVTGAALFDLPGQALPVQGSALSLPDHGTPALNGVYLTEGRLPVADGRDEALLLDGFARARGIRPGDVVTVTQNGNRRDLRITGLAQAPELLYVAVPGELVPDDARFAVFWMRRAEMETAYDMDGAVNEVLIALSRNAREAEVIDAVDRVLKPFGGLGAYGREDHMSDRFISEEIRSLRSISGAVPPLFLAIAAFLLYIVISRMVQSEREEIGLLKAFGYSNPEVGAHYFKLVLVISVGGAALGCLLGIWAGRWMIQLYTIYYKFPFIVFRLEPASFATGMLASIAAASAGGLFVLRQVFALAPAEAMRPPVPPDFSHAFRFGPMTSRLLDQPTRMVLRRFVRQPVRMAGLIAGIAGSMALSVAVSTLHSAFAYSMDLSFSVMDRSDVLVSFNHALGYRAVFEIGQLDGVRFVEPVRDVPVVLHNGTHSHRGAITGLPPDVTLARAVDADMKQIDLPGQGVVLAEALADILSIEPGGVVTVEVRDGSQPVLDLPVTGVAQSLLGAPAYMDFEALGRALGEPGRVSGARLLIDADKSDAIYRALKDMPVVAGVSVAEDARKSLTELMNSGAGASRYVMGVIAFIITFGIIYNAARIAHAERARDLASLRVLGFSRGEAAFVLLGELGIVTLAALPLGAFLGQQLSHLMARGFSTELYQIPVVLNPESHGYAALFVLAATLVSGWLVKRDLDRADLITALKTRE